MLFIALGEDFPNIEYHRVKHKAAYLGMKNPDNLSMDEVVLKRRNLTPSG